MVNTAAKVKIVILNGPPGAGKDELIKQLNVKTNLSILPLSMSDSLYLTALAAFGILENDVNWKNGEALDYFLEHKHMPMTEFDGRNFREVVIKIGETMKTIFGSNHWIKIIMSKIRAIQSSMRPKDQPLIIMISGLGFPIELEAFEKSEFAEDCVLIRVNREGKTYGKFEGNETFYGDETGVDSRNWLFSDVITELELTNNETKTDLAMDAITELNKLFPIKNFLLDNQMDKLTMSALMPNRTSNNIKMPPIPRFGRENVVYRQPLTPSIERQ